MTGIVYKSTGSWYSIKSQDGAFYECRIKGKFRIKGIKSTNPLAVGDRVDFDLETSNNTETGCHHNHSSAYQLHRSEIGEPLQANPHHCE